MRGLPIGSGQVEGMNKSVIGKAVEALGDALVALWGESDGVAEVSSAVSSAGVTADDGQVRCVSDPTPLRCTPSLQHN